MSFVFNDTKVSFNIISADHFFNTLFCVGVFECLYVVVQYLVFLKYGLYAMLPTGTFENPAGIITHLVLLFPLGLSWLFKTSGKIKAIVMFLLLLYIFVICICESRTGLVAVLVSSFVLFSNNILFRKFFRKPLVIMGLIFLFFLLCWYVYRWKLDSANGRILIWKICFNMIKAKPFLGYGIDGFTANYMLAQANYFFYYPDSQYSQLADNTSNPFNLFLHVTIVFGFIGLLCLVLFIAFLFYRVSRLKNKNNDIWYSVMSSLLTMSMFTYPLYYAPVWLLSLLLIIYPIYDLLPCRIGLASRIIIVGIIGFCLYRVNHMVLNEIRWKHIQDKSIKEGQGYEMLKYYKRLYPELKNNKYFLYNYGAELNCCGYYFESKKIMDECEKRLNNYDVQLIKADNYCNMGDTLSAIKSIEIASMMIPCRFIPLQELLEIYISSNNEEKALLTAEKILNKTVKIPSDLVEDIKEEAVTIINCLK